MGDRGSNEAKKPAVVPKQAATPLQLKGKVSKNQRVGIRQFQVKPQCSQGHDQTHTLLSPVRGHARMVLMCACNSYATANDPPQGAWVQRKARINVSTRARVWYEQPSGA